MDSRGPNENGQYQLWAEFFCPFCGKYIRILARDWDEHYIRDIEYKEEGGEE